jgi:hypothetical protein
VGSRHPILVVFAPISVNPMPLHPGMEYYCRTIDSGLVGLLIIAVKLLPAKIDVSAKVVLNVSVSRDIHALRSGCVALLLGHRIVVVTTRVVPTWRDCCYRYSLRAPCDPAGIRG